MLNVSKLPTPDSIPGNNTVGTSRIQIPRGIKLSKIALHPYGDNGSTGTALDSLVTEVRVVLNGKVQIQGSPAQLNGIQALNGSAWAEYDSGGSTGRNQVLNLFFERRWMKARNAASIGQWNLHPDDVNSLYVEVDWAGSNAASKTLYGDYEWEPLEGRLGNIFKVSRNQIIASGTDNVNSLTNMVPSSDLLTEIHIPKVGTTTSVVKTTLNHNGTYRFEEVDYFQQRAGLLAADLNPPTLAVYNNYSLILDRNEPAVDAIAMRQANQLDLRTWYGTVATTTTVVTYAAPGSATAMPVLLVHYGPPN